MTYAVVWRENGDPSYSGRLELGPDCGLLSGSAYGRDAQCDFRYDDLVSLNLDRERLSGRPVQPTLVLTTNRHDRIEIASLHGLGALHEVAERIELARGKAAV